MVQRFMAAKSKKTAQLSLILNVPLVFFLMSLCIFSGLILYSNFFYCDPLKSKEIKGPNELVGHFVVKHLNMIPGMSGLFLASLLCGSLSSLSSLLNSQVSIIWNDFFKSLNFFKKFDEKRSLLINKLLVIVFGVLGTGFAFFISTFGGSIIQINLSLNGALVAPILGLFILGSFFKFTNSIGAICGTVAGFAVGLWISLGTYFKKPIYQKLPVTTEYCNLSNLSSFYVYENFYKQKMILENELNSSYIDKSGRALNLQGFDTIYSLSYQWYTAFGLVVTILVGLVSSCFVNCAIRNRKEVNDDFVISDLGSIFRRKIVKSDKEIENIEENVKFNNEND